MTDDFRDDLAYLRTLAESGGRHQWSGGVIFLAGGLLYGFQCIVQWAAIVGLIPLQGMAMLAFVTAITLAFIIVIVLVQRRSPRLDFHSVANRAFQAAFVATGLANLALVAIFAAVAIPRHDIVIWEMYPAALGAIMGSAWFVAFRLRKKAWLALVSAGWFASAVLLALLVDTVAYVLAVGLVLIVLMALPGAYMMRLARKD